MFTERTKAEGLQLSVGQFSSAGVKPRNQDSMAARVPGLQSGLKSDAIMKGAAFAVADGISSSQISQVAAETAVKALVTDYYSTPQAWTVKSSAARVIEATNSWLFAQNRAQRTSDMNHGMVCTLSALILKAGAAHIFHIGDSRVSRLRKTTIEPLTQDHTTVISEDEHLLGRALGAQPRLDIDYHSFVLEKGDVFLLTTDGVHEFSNGEIAHNAIKKNTNLDLAAEEIAKEARKLGSKDNLTVQIVRIEDLPDADYFQQIIDSPLPASLPLAPNQKLDGFRVVREIQHTSRSQLTLAIDSSNHRYALKVPGTEIRENPEALQRFLFEEWIARRVNSPHIVKAARSTGPRSRSYVATQWIEGSSLRQWMNDNPNPSLGDVRAIADQLVRGLRVLHRQEMIHQDLRPENIMLDENGTAVIIDLGSVAVAGVEQATSGAMGALPGTFQYTAPEYLSGDRVSWRSDQFSLGVIIYELLTRELPYGAQVARVRNRADQRRLRYRASDLGENKVPGWVDHALKRACHRDPHRRYDALSEFMADLRSPATEFKPQESRPLLERNPLKFWQGLALVQLFVIIILLAYQANLLS